MLIFNYAFNAIALQLCILIEQITESLSWAIEALRVFSCWSSRFFAKLLCTNSNEWCVWGNQMKSHLWITTQKGFQCYPSSIMSQQKINHYLHFLHYPCASKHISPCTYDGIWLNSFLISRRIIFAKLFCVTIYRLTTDICESFSVVP